MVGSGSRRDSLLAMRPRPHHEPRASRPSPRSSPTWSRRPPSSSLPVTTRPPGTRVLRPFLLRQRPREPAELSRRRRHVASGLRAGAGPLCVSRYGPAMGPRLLIAAGEAAARGRQLPGGIRSLIDAAEEIMVISPALPGRLDWIASDTDKATARADERL